MSGETEAQLAQFECLNEIGGQNSVCSSHAQLCLLPKMILFQERTWVGTAVKFHSLLSESGAHNPDGIVKSVGKLFRTC